MRSIPLYQCDAFVTERAFSGNPAAVCPLPRWLADADLVGIASSNNLSETAYLVGSDGIYDLRWFTPEAEVDLCGHATLASAWVVCERLEPGRDAVRFRTRSGDLLAERRDALIAIDLPARPAAAKRVATEAFARALGRAPREVLDAPYWLAVFESEADIEALVPDVHELRELGRPVICTAPGNSVDFVSRFFAPTVGVLEDPVTGSAHCTLAPYWAARLGRTELHARQLSRRGGALTCEVRGARIALSGEVRPFLEGRIAR